MTANSRTTKGPKNSFQRGKERLKKNINSGKATIASSHTSSTSSTPETGPLSSCNSGKSSSKGSKGGSLLKVSSLGSLLKHPSRGRIPPSTPPQEYQDDASSYGGSRPATPNRVPSVNGDASSVGSGSPGDGRGRRDNRGGGRGGKGGVDHVEILTNMFDRKGYCVRHPNVRLRKKKLLGDWKVLTTNCPDCCVEEMDRMKRIRNGTGNNKNISDKGSVKKKEMKKDKKKKKKMQRGMSDLTGGLNRARSRGRMPEVKNDPKVSSHSGKSRSLGKSRDRQSLTSRGGPRNQVPNNNRHHDHLEIPTQNDGTPIFEFDIKLDEQGDVTSPKSVKSSRKSVKSVKSASSKKSSKSARTSKSGKSTRTNKSSKSTRTNKTGKSTRTNKSSRSTRTNKSSRSTRTNKSSKSTRTNKSSKSRLQRVKSQPKIRNDGGGDENVVSRGSHPGSSQRFIRKDNTLRVAKMPFTDRYKRPGNYTGEINEFGQPHGKGTLRYNTGTVFEGLWWEGRADEMDAEMEKTKEGFTGNWKDKTKMAKKDMEKRKEKDMDDLRSFISQSVRSGSVGGGGGSLMGGTGGQHGSDNSSNINSRRPSPRQGGGTRKEQVHEVPWSDVNGFSGHYSGEVNGDQIPDGQGSMRYSNGIVEKGTFCNGVYQPPSGPPPKPIYGTDQGGEGKNQAGVPSSSMSVWSLKSSPTMAFVQGGHNVLTGQRPGGSGEGGEGGESSVMGAPTSVHMGGPPIGSGAGGLY